MGKKRNLQQRQDASNAAMEEQPGDPEHTDQPDCPACAIAYGRYAESIKIMVEGSKDPWAALALFLSDYTNNLVSLALGGHHPLEIITKTTCCANALMRLPELREAGKRLGIYNEAMGDKQFIIAIGQQRQANQHDHHDMKAPGMYL